MRRHGLNVEYSFIKHFFDPVCKLGAWIEFRVVVGRWLSAESWGERPKYEACTEE